MDAAKAVASGVSLCRDLVNSPPNMLTPGALADAASKIAEDHGLECEILEVSEVISYFTVPRKYGFSKICNNGMHAMRDAA